MPQPPKVPGPIAAAAPSGPPLALPTAEDGPSGPPEFGASSGSAEVLSRRSSLQDNPGFGSSDGEVSAWRARCPGTAQWERGSTASRASVCRVLSTKVRSQILRGVPVAQLLRSFGRAFEGHDFAVDNYGKSMCVGRLHDFISHDWGSSRADKFLALCAVYNAWPAAVVSTGLGLALAAGQLLELLPTPKPPQEGPTISYYYGYWSQLLCPPAFFLLLFWWQELEERLRRRLGAEAKVAFLDKYCIDQVDEERKQEGILGLAGFLRSTERLVVCWTPRYFTRLWCAYEVATWLYLSKPLDSVLFMPLAHARAMVVFCATASLFLLAYASSMIFIGSTSHVLNVVGGLCVVLPLPAHKLRRYIREVRKLPQQLQAFSIGDARCFCCEHRHANPLDPSESLPCDRILVEQTVSAWFMESGKDALRSFDLQVRRLFGSVVLERAGPAQLAYRYLVLFGWCFLFRACDCLVALRTQPADMVLRRFFEIVIFALFVVPVALNLDFRLAALADRAFGAPKSRCLDLLLSCALALGFIVTDVALWLPLTLSNEFTTALPFLLVSALEMLLAAALFSSSLKRFRHNVFDEVPKPAAPPGLDELKVYTFGDLVAKVRRVEI